MIYIDQAINPWRGKKWCHLVADTLPELHDFAVKLGLKRSWFQDHKVQPHYDVSSSLRRKAISMGAKELSTQEMALRTRELLKERVKTMFKPSAKIIADSVNESGDRLTTFVLTYHRFIHSEFMTHRMLSKNSSSSRAIPVEKMIALVESAQVEPLHWGANCKGMSAKAELGDTLKYQAKMEWDYARDNAIRGARNLVAIGVHKQVVNRLLEPFAPITVICTATEYSNFFAQRCHPDAQPEIRALADAMRDAYDASKPEVLNAGDWHLPFISREDWMEATDRGFVDEDMIKIAIGRCARVSYLNHDGIRSLSDDTKLYWRLLESKPAHLSPFEHIAIALPNSDRFANFKGFQSYRNILEVESSFDKNIPIRRQAQCLQT